MTVDAERLEGQRVQVISLDVLVFFIIRSLSVGLEVKALGQTGMSREVPRVISLIAPVGKCFQKTIRLFQFWADFGERPRVALRLSGEIWGLLHQSLAQTLHELVIIYLHHQFVQR